MSQQCRATNTTMCCRDFGCNEKAKVSTLAPTAAMLTGDLIWFKPILGCLHRLSLPQEAHNP